MARELTAPPKWAALIRAYGTVKDLADAVPVHEQTVRKWYQGKHPIDDFKARRIRELAKRKGVPSPV